MLWHNFLDAVFRRVTPEVKQAQLLHDARMSLLDAECSAEYWIAMAAVLQQRVARLEQAK